MRRGRQVIEVAGPPHSVTAQASAHEAGRFQSPELLQDARPAGAHPIGHLIRGCRSAGPERIQDLASQGGRGAWPGRRGCKRRRGPNPALDDLGVRAVLERVVRSESADNVGRHEFRHGVVPLGLSGRVGHCGLRIHAEKVAA